MRVNKELAKKLGIKLVTKSKYGNQIIKEDDITFDSKKERDRYCKLLWLEKAGEIKNLRHHVCFPLTCNEHHIANYESDFLYEETWNQIDWHSVIEDAKGHQTDVFKLKWKMMIALYGDKYVLRMT